MSIYFEGEELEIELDDKELELVRTSGVDASSYDDIFPNQIYSVNNKFAAKVTSGKLKKYNLKNKRKGLNAVDFRQAIALDHILDDSIQLSVCLGKAGTGKTYLALGSALKALSEERVDKIFFIKPLVGVSKSKYMGTLPGGIDEKTAPFIDSFRDVAIDLGLSDSLQIYLDEKFIDFIAIDFIRGRNLNNCWVIVDEAQNLDRHALLAVLSRLGKGGRMIVLGDANPEQNDLRECSGLEYLISSKSFWESPFTSCIHLKKRMRAPIVELVEEILA